MRAMTLGVTLALVAASAFAQQGTFPGGAGGGGTPGGSSGQIQVNSSGSFGGVAVNGSGNVLEAAGTVNVTTGKTAAFSNSITFAGVDGYTMTFPSGNQTIAGWGSNNVFTGTNTFLASTTKIHVLAPAASGHTADSDTTPSVSAGFGGTTTIPSSNGSFAFMVTVGATSPAATGNVLTMGATAFNGWVCTATDYTTPSEQVRETTYSQTAPSFTFFNWAGTATAPTAGDVIGFLCRAD